MAFKISARSIARSTSTVALPASLSALSFPLTPACLRTVDVCQPWLIHRLKRLSSRQAPFSPPANVHWVADVAYLGESLRFQPRHCLGHHHDLCCETTSGQGNISAVPPSQCSLQPAPQMPMSSARAYQQTQPICVNDHTTVGRILINQGLSLSLIGYTVLLYTLSLQANAYWKKTYEVYVGTDSEEIICSPDSCSVFYGRQIQEVTHNFTCHVFIACVCPEFLSVPVSPFTYDSWSG